MSASIPRRALLGIVVAVTATWLAPGHPVNAQTVKTISQATLELVINLKTAKGLGLTISPSLLAKADHILE